MAFDFGTEEAQRRVTRADILNGAPALAGDVYNQTIAPFRQQELETQRRAAEEQAASIRDQGKTIADTISGTTKNFLDAKNKADERADKKQLMTEESRMRAAQTAGLERNNLMEEKYGDTQRGIAIDTGRAQLEGAGKQNQMADVELDKAKKTQDYENAVAKAPDAQPGETVFAYRQRKQDEIQQLELSGKTTQVALAKKNLNAFDKNNNLQNAMLGAQARQATIQADDATKQQQVAHVSSRLKLLDMTDPKQLAEAQNLIKLANDYGVDPTIVMDAIDKNSSDYSAKQTALMFQKQLDPMYQSSVSDAIAGKQQVVETQKLLARLENLQAEYKKENNSAWFDNSRVKDNIAEMQGILRQFGKTAQADRLGELIDPKQPLENRAGIMQAAISGIGQELKTDVEVQAQYNPLLKPLVGTILKTKGTGGNANPFATPVSNNLGPTGFGAPAPQPRAPGVPAGYGQQQPMAPQGQPIPPQMPPPPGAFKLRQQMTQGAPQPPQPKPAKPYYPGTTRGNFG